MRMRSGQTALKRDPFDEDKKANVKQAVQPTLRSRALRLLARRDWSQQALRERLQTHVAEGGAEDLEALLNEFTDRGWISDARYAEAVVRQRKDRYGKAAIARRLKQAGVSDAAITQAVGALDADHEFQTARALWRRKFRQSPRDDKEKARQIRFLQARGYSLALALRVLKNGGADNDSDNEDEEEEMRQ
ncbi:MAG: regulatory protein RecX [Betaproteobacteria bacterium]|nr:regulatory protein RecX [Betaproteobacteria bacterium]